MELRRTIGTWLDKASRRLLDEGPAIPPRQRPRSARPRKVLFLGGSNTVMREGYSEALIASLEDRMGRFRKVTNLAAGANSSVHGLMLVKGLPDLAEYDLIFIEYGVNDAKLAGRVMLPTWQATVEGMLRHILENRPDRPVFQIQFARRERRPHHQRISDWMGKLVAHYGRTHPVGFIDIDRPLRDVLFPKQEDFLQLYSDGAHFERPRVAKIIGAWIAAEVLGRKFNPEIPATLPHPLNAWHYQNAQIVPFVSDATAARIFSNSRFQIPTRRLVLGESLELDIPGRLLCLEYISARDSGTLLVAESGNPVFSMHTRHKAAGPKMPFLVKSMPMFWTPGHEAVKGEGHVRFTAAANAQQHELRPEHSMIAAEAGAESSVYLSRMLCVP